MLERWMENMVREKTCRHGNVPEIARNTQFSAEIRSNKAGKTPAAVARAAGRSDCEAYLEVIESVKRNQPSVEAKLASAKPGETAATQATRVVALYPFQASESPAFPPDPRMETDLRTGEIYFVKSVREDGWCLVTRSDDSTEYWAPGNYLSTNGSYPLLSFVIEPCCDSNLLPGVLLPGLWSMPIQMRRSCSERTAGATPFRE
jgi:hypothetical protein